ncbi:hypothetical protein HZS38_19075 [Xenorhabdus nematophila]|uniref:hypothetical protein n=2 Tax=Xenorhabdus nematophila TaxID=628 RepID=UPI000543089C|nr:hypothetical protein [Xenorhabdus nematophila]KHD28720.1 hypothetical protein LH67_08520 [Xenorhabdus nematophila]MBA0021133.1 hypothetical protein [Xenorhabdus nematophila]CEF33625.1 conserved hypothetical protein [Xenorhabdus nematophila str. Websteri]
MARKAKYSEEWRSRAAALQANIEEAMKLASASIGDDDWLHRLHVWVAEVVQGNAPDWWTDLDCEVSLPREEKRVSTFISTQRKRITFQMCLA